MRLRASLHPSFDLRIALRLGLKLIQALPAAKPVLAPLEHLGVSFIWLNLHATNWILRRHNLHICTSAWSVTGMSFVPSVAVDHVRSTTKTHHEIEKRSK
jgi:hypothetical protein